MNFVWASGYAKTSCSPTDFSHFAMAVSMAVFHLGAEDISGLTSEMSLV